LFDRPDDGTSAAVYMANIPSEIFLGLIVFWKHVSIQQHDVVI